MTNDIKKKEDIDDAAKFALIITLFWIKPTQLPTLKS